jgi:molecular chaperone GrpE
LIFAAQALISGASYRRMTHAMNETVKSPADEPVPANGAGMDGQTSDPAATERDGFAVIEALNTENAALKDRMLRTLAEMENLRRRTEREVADAKNYGVTNLARDMLNVADNLARALEHIPAEVRANADGEFKSLIEGVELTARDLTAALGRHGVRLLEPLGEKFDPNFHQALFEVPNEALPAGTVTQVVQSGWRIGERVLRPASVGVSKGGPKTAVAPD